MLPWQHETKMLLTSIISMSNYTFIVCIVFDLEGYMSPHYNVLPEALCLFTCKPCCLQTCNYDHSLVVTDTNTPTKYQVLILLTF